MKIHIMEFCTNETGLQSYRLVLMILNDRWHRTRYEYEVEENIPHSGTTKTIHRITWWKRGIR